MNHSVQRETKPQIFMFLLFVCIFRCVLRILILFSPIHIATMWFGSTGITKNMKQSNNSAKFQKHESEKFSVKLWKMQIIFCKYMYTYAVARLSWPWHLTNLLILSALYYLVTIAHHHAILSCYQCYTYVKINPIVFVSLNTFACRKDEIFINCGCAKVIRMIETLLYLLCMYKVCWYYLADVWWGSMTRIRKSQDIICISITHVSK